jgi:hypothetical protein
MAEDNRVEALEDMEKAARKLIQLIGAEKAEASGGPSWDAIEGALLDIRDAWEGCKACEITTALRKRVPLKIEKIFGK